MLYEVLSFEGFRVASSIHSLLVLAIGFAVAGLAATAYQLITAQPASFALLGRGERQIALISVPFLLFAAPFIIIRNTIRGARLERRKFAFAMLAAMIAGFWSLMSGTVVVTVLVALGLLHA